MADPVVSVLIPTYNHRAHLRQAVEGALAQETDFPIEILVGDDASTDGTTGVVRELEKEYAGRVTAFISPRNEGGHANFSRLYRAARGEFIALCEGDDAWTDPRKLSLQVAFLRENPEYALCFHPLRMIDDDGLFLGLTNEGDPVESTINRLAKFNYIHTASVVFRNRLVPDLPRWVFRLMLGDWPLFCLVAQHGKLRLLDEVMGIYRVHAGGVWGNRSDSYRLALTIHAAVACQKHIGHPGFDDCILKMGRRVLPGLVRERKWKHARQVAAWWLAAALRSPRTALGMKLRRRNAKTMA